MGNLNLVSVDIFTIYPKSNKTERDSKTDNFAKIVGIH